MAYETVSSLPLGRTRLATKAKRSKPMLVMLTTLEHEGIVASSLARGMTISDFVRTACARFSVAPTRIKKPSAHRPGGVEWLWTKVHEELELWKQGGCEGKFRALREVNGYLKEITKGTHLTAGEAEDAIRDFLYRHGKKVDKLAKKVLDHWTRQNKGRVDPNADDQSDPND